MTLEQWLILAGFVLLVIALLWLALFLNRMRLKKQNKWGQKQIRSILRKFAAIRSFKVINDITLPNPGSAPVHIDHILIGFFGMILLETRNEGGNVFGDYKSTDWIAVKLDSQKREKKVTFPNPVLRMQRANEALRKILADAKLYKVENECYVVFNDNKAQLAIGKGLPVITKKALKKLLQKSKYSADGPVDVNQVYELLKKKAVS